MHHITILGAGSWGTALALALARNQHTVTLWGKDSDELEAIAVNKVNTKYLPNIPLSEKITVEKNLHRAISVADFVILAIPSHAIADIASQIFPVISLEIPIIIAAKGLDPQTGLLLPELLNNLRGDDTNIAVLAGPTFAREVALALPTAMTIASKQMDLGLKIARLFQQNTLKPYVNHDLIGTALGGALKNVIAIAVGISDGQHYGANARSALITRGLAEIVRLGRKMSALPDTLYGLAGVGDLLLTCTDDQSRNRRFGLLLGQGMTMQQALNRISQVVEGATNAEQVYMLSQKYQVEMPITSMVYEVLHKNLSTSHAVEKLLSRDVREEGI